MLIFNKLPAAGNIRLMGYGNNQSFIADIPPYSDNVTFNSKLKINRKAIKPNAH
jgi:hypothetical protein